MVRYSITDRALFSGDELDRRQALVRQAESLARQGVDYLQVREKDLADDDLATVVNEVVAAARSLGGMKVLVNSSIAVAVQTGADGVHLPTEQLGQIAPAGLLVSTSCHSLEEVNAAVKRGVDLILFSPVFGKSVWGEEVKPGIGIDALKQAVAAAGKIPVLALGGITQENMQACIDAGAAGVAGIRMFMDDASKGA